MLNSYGKKNLLFLNGIVENENLHHSHKFGANVVMLRASPLRSGVVPNCPEKYVDIW